MVIENVWITPAILISLAALTPRSACARVRQPARIVQAAGAANAQSEFYKVDGEPPQVRLRCGLWLEAGSDAVTNRRGRPFQRVDGDPSPGQYAITPAGAVTFNRRDRGAEVNVSYRFERRVAAILPIPSADAPPQAALDIYDEAAQEFRARGCDTASLPDVERISETWRVYPSGELPPELVMRLGHELRVQDLVVLRVERYQSRTGRSLFGFLWTGPFGGGRKRIDIALHARILDTDTGRLVWESQDDVERQGSHLGAVHHRLRTNAIDSAVTALFRSYFEP